MSTPRGTRLIALLTKVTFVPSGLNVAWSEDPLSAGSCSTDTSWVTPASRSRTNTLPPPAPGSVRLLALLSKTIFRPSRLNSGLADCPLPLRVPVASIESRPVVPAARSRR